MIDGFDWKKADIAQRTDALAWARVEKAIAEARRAEHRKRSERLNSEAREEDYKASGQNERVKRLDAFISDGIKSAQEEHRS